MKNRFMRIAIEEALRGVNAGHGGPFGAVVVRRGTVEGRAHNEVLRTGDPTAHAEVLAIRKAAARLRSHNLSSCTLYTTCEPCPMCLGAALWARIPRIVFGCTGGDAARLGFSDREIRELLGSHRGRLRSREGERIRSSPAEPPAGKTRIKRTGPAMVNMGRKECLAVFSHWEQHPRHRLY
ncbi:MAG: Guanine deaminase [Acidobacteria bacterium]|nr:Guanine deaminase [Acidobacteriota bacterium]